MGKIFNNDEEKRLVVMAKKGDDKAFEKLKELYKPLFRKSAGRIPTLATEIMSAVYEAFWLAVKKFDEGKHVPFAAYLKKMVRCAAFGAYRNEIKFAERHFLPPEENNPINYTESERDDIGEFEVREDILNAMEYLTDREKEVINAIYFKGLNTVETGKFLGISKKTVSDAKIRALRKLRGRISGM